MNTLLLILSMMLMSWSKPADGPSGSPGASGGVVATDGLSVEERARFARAANYSKQHEGHAVLIQRGGSILFERYEDGWTGDRAHPLASGTKSFTGVAAMFAVQDGLLTLDERVSDTITEWKSDPKKSKITVRQLLDLSSGLEPGERVGPRVQRGERIARPDNAFADALKAPGELEPGTRFRYGPTHFYAFGALLERKLATSSLPVKKAWDYYELRIFKPLGMEIGRIGRDRAGNPNLPGGAMVSARQWVKFGEFVLRNGKATITSGPEKGSRKQLLKPELLAECFVPSKANAAYGLTWWLRNSRAGGPGQDIGVADGQPEPDTGPAPTPEERAQQRNLDSQTTGEILGPDGKPITVLMAAGLGKQRLYVLPQYDMVIVRFGELRSENRGFDDREFLGRVLGMVGEDSGDKKK